MPNQKNIDVVSVATEKFESSKGIYFTKYTGMDVGKMTSLRKAFRDSSVEYSVIKNTLAKIASKNAGMDGIFDEILKGQVAIAFSEDPIAPAKVIKNFKDENKDDLEILGLYFDGELYDADKYKEFASLASKEELLGKLVSCLSSPMFKLASTLNGSMSKVVFALKAIKK
jgi:large subunit ribosomal protein L10